MVEPFGLHGQIWNCKISSAVHMKEPSIFSRRKNVARRAAKHARGQVQRCIQNKNTCLEIREIIGVCICGTTFFLLERWRRSQEQGRTYQIAQKNSRYPKIYLLRSIQLNVSKEKNIRQNSNWGGGGRGVDKGRMKTYKSHWQFFLKPRSIHTRQKGPISPVRSHSLSLLFFRQFLIIENKRLKKYKHYVKKKVIGPKGSATFFFLKFSFNNTNKNE